MKPYNHQIDIAAEALTILREHGLVYLAMEERTGKTLTAILMAEYSKAKNILVLTKKKALDGWNDTLKKYKHVKKFTVTNYHQAGKLSANYDLVILDESHSYLSAYPKVGTIWKSVYKLTKNRPLIYLSATPHAQGLQLLYNQFRLSSWSPWKRYSNFYNWHRYYGIPDKTRTPYGLVETYKVCKVHEVMLECEHLFITKTRAELDFEHEPEDVIHMIELSDSTKALYNEVLSKEIWTPKGITIPIDSPMKMRTTLHMIEGGVGKNVDNYFILDNTEKIDAIKKDFGDTENVCIMYNYIAEGKKLNQHFKQALILQATSFAEGVDLSHVEHLIVYSQDFSTARHSQRRARQANKKRATEIKVHFYLVRDAISHQVYKTVSKNKTNFIDSVFERKTL